MIRTGTGIVFDSVALICLIPVIHCAEVGGLSWDSGWPTLGAAVPTVNIAIHKKRLSVIYKGSRRWVMQ